MGLDHSAGYEPPCGRWVFGYYSGDEFAFDGRKLGLGFNGAIILRDDSFSVHT